MYVIVTTNVKLVVYIKKLNGNHFMGPQQINQERYNREAMLTTTNKELAMLALVDGAKVYESMTKSNLIPICDSKDELIDYIIDNFLESIGIHQKCRGYDYVRYMLKCNVKDEDYCLKSMVKDVYPECAKVFEVNTATVARYANKIIKDSYKRNSLKYEALYQGTHLESFNEVTKVNNFVGIMANKIRNLVY